MKNENIKVAIVGGGIAGSTAAMCLGKLGLDITLFEKNRNLVSGPPICHLHAGGNLYREISDESCKILLKESIDLLKLYPNAIDYRPTILATPKTDDIDPIDLIPRLEYLKNEYKKLIEKDSTNEVLSFVDNYYKIYTKDDILKFKEKDIVKEPKSFDQWIIPFAKYTNLDKLKFPVIAVQEYGLNIFRLGSMVNLELDKLKNVKILFESTVTNIEETNNQTFNIEYKKDDNINLSEFDYIINSAGFRTGLIDDMLNIKRDSLVEFKAAYVTKWDGCKDRWPEIIFFGKRGTPEGMGQFTPYFNNHFQIHGMTEDITLFKDGLVKNDQNSSQPQLDTKFIDKIEKSWDAKEIEARTKKAIEHIQQYLPIFTDIKVASKPLYGAQQIPGDDANLRTANVSFDKKGYARCEIVKANSVLSMVDEIIKNMRDIGLIDIDNYEDKISIKDIDDKKITKKAKEIATNLNYPTDLAYRVVEVV